MSGGNNKSRRVVEVGFWNSLEFNFWRISTVWEDWAPTASLLNDKGISGLRG